MPTVRLVALLYNFIINMLNILVLTIYLDMKKERLISVNSISLLGLLDMKIMMPK